ncbi:centromeric protein E [Cryptococcus wingfieldii CBS 7118]|uniref:Centromeric protein E n=1 Tax=Cryptococcus wingfieldii CBS 7118 TaxID=1295528 RepID=A0A1E3K017_9TREE|nr:centromeric protein E [Cryptococcus wingfieldii CBS 7118]ODO06440.1 centromeric protein E [Cryptococcus wingfieldii CBS 7118]
MSLTLSRQPSSPSLALGLPPAFPENNIMAPSTSPSKMPRTKSKHKIHRGDVESTDSSDFEEAPKQLVKGTPKRKVVNSVEPTPATGQSKKRGTLAERLAAAAVNKPKVKSSSSVNGGLKASSSATQLSASSTSSTVQTPTMQARTSLIPSTMPVKRTAGPSIGGNPSDKVVVCVRIKPTQSPFATMAYDMTSTSLTLSDDHPKVKQRGGKAGREDTYNYTFDKLLQHPSTTPELYTAKVSPLVDKAMSGFNSTVFAYGQTGSGKSFTMTGIPTELGIIPCAVDGVFDAITADTDRAFLLRVSYVEIYNETLRDLLNFKKGPLKDDEKPVIHTQKGKVYVEPLVEEIVSTPEDVMELLEKGNAQRRIGATDWNERSSRSHCVFTVVIESKPRDKDGDEDIRLSRLNLIDLAGSEKAVSDSERRGEGKHINQSLLALREVINKLTEKQKASHIPYRNSKLTHLLENALGGDSNICVICTMSAEEEHCGETLETLKFAGRCSQVKTHAKKNILPASERAMIRAKDQEIEELRARLLGLTGDSAPPKAGPDADQITDLADSVAAMEARKAKLTAQLAKLNGEILTSELPRHSASSFNLPQTPSKPKRRRISDFSAIMSSGGDRMGLGMGTPKKAADRRAVSNLVGVKEESETSATLGTLDSVHEGSINFEHDIALATLRKNLAHKEEELVLANRNLASALSRASQLSERDERVAALTVELSTALQQLSELQSTLLSTESDLRDQNAQLESARDDLVSNIGDKSSKIDELENKVLELRKSREEMAIEDESRLQEVQKELAGIAGEKAKMQARVELLEKEAVARKGAEEGQKAAEEEVQRIQSELDSLRESHSQAQSSAASSSSKAIEHETTISTLTSQITDLLAAQASRETALNAVKSEHAEITKKRDQAVEDLDSFQKQAMANETKVLSELREEIGKLRKLREDDKVEWEKQKAELEAGFAELKEREDKSKAQLAEALHTLESAAAANKKLESNVAKVDEAKSAAEKERDQAVDNLKEASGRAKIQLEQEIEYRRSLEAQLSSLQQQLDAQRATIENVSQDLQCERESAKELSEKLATAHTDMETQEVRIEKAVDERKDIEARLGEMESALEAGEEEWKARIDKESAKRSKVEGKLVELEKMRQVGNTTEKELIEKLSSLQTQLSADQTVTDDLRKKLEIEVTAKMVAEKKVVELGRQKVTSSAAETDLQKQLENAERRRKEAETKAAEVEKEREVELAGLRAQLDAEKASKADVERKLSEAAEQHVLKLSADGEIRSLLDKETSARKDADSKLADLAKKLESSSSAEKQIQHKLDVESASRQAAEKQLVELSSKLKSVSSNESELGARLDKETASKQAAEKRLADVQRGVETKQASVLVDMKKEIASLRQSLLKAQSDAQSSRDEATAHREKATKLAKDVVELEARQKNEISMTASSVSARLRTLSTPGPWAKDGDMSGPGSKGMKSRGLKGTTTGMGIGERESSMGTMRARDQDEIERLEKVIEVQKEIIDEQREKIERWSKEMEKQREIVRLLTNDHSNTTYSPSPRVPSRTHAKAHSISHSPTESPAGSTPAKAIPSTFTARNLALPSTPLPGTPTPLPMHPSQFNNATARKGRRITIDHDMDLLTETSKVNRAKLLFESPEKNGKALPSTPVREPRESLRVNQAAWSIPRQRRP